MIGTSLKHYRILRQIGSGGMGEVYEAEDTKLHRKVAVKVLPKSVAADPERRERFEREARAVAALNHPNIVTIHSVEESDVGPFLTMELVEGTTLAALVTPAGMPIDRLLSTGIAVADAIAAAQHRGITHRDLKPANVMLTTSGQVKVLDFGLAKLRDDSSASETEGATRLATTGLTGEGRILGTVAYMSPEQAEGKPVDSRSDIFSLGVMLHEMATGTRPFSGDTPVSVLSSIIKDSPSSVTDLKPGLPPDLARMIKRCLAKDPDRRYQDALDLRNDLEELRTAWQSGEIAVSGARRGAAGPGRSTTRLVAGAGVVIVAIAAATYLAMRSRQPVAPAASDATLAELRPSRLTYTGTASLAAISPDGRYVVHVVREGGMQSLWIRQTATTSNVQIVPPAEVRYDGLTISPDGTYVYYSAYEGAQAYSTLYQVPALGGRPREVLEDIDSPIAFSPDGSEFAFVRGIPDPPGTQLLAASVDGSRERVLARTAPDETFRLERPAWAPDGRRVAIAYASIEAGGNQGVATIDVASGQRTPVGGPVWSSVSDLAWLPDGSALVASATEKGATNQQIWRIGVPNGDATRITNDLTSYAGVSLSSDGRALVTVRTDVVSNLWVVPAADLAAARQITSGTDRYDGAPGVAWTPGGRVVYSSAASGNVDIWIADADGSNQEQLTDSPEIDAQPAVCGGGRFIVFASLRGGRPAVWRTALDGSSPVRLSTTPVGFSPTCTHDGDDVVYTSLLEGRTSLWRVKLEGGEAAKVRELQTQNLAISPDGRFVAGPFIDSATQRQSIAIIALGSDAAPQVFPIYPRPVRWSPDGKALTYVNVRDGVANIWKQPLPDGTAAPVTQFTSGLIYNFDWSLDGTQLVLARGATTTDVVLLSAER